MPFQVLPFVPQLCSHSFTDSPRKEVYFMAIIDILTHYDAKKKAAHAAKTVKHGVSIFLLFPSLLLGPWVLQAVPFHFDAQSPSVVLVSCRGSECKIQGQQMPMPMRPFSTAYVFSKSPKLSCDSSLYIPGIFMDTCITRMLYKFFSVWRMSQRWKGWR